MIIGAVCGAFIGTMLMLALDPIEKLTATVIINTLFLYTFVGSVFAWIVAGVIGIPLYLLYRRMGWVKLWQYLLGGMFCAIPFWALWFYPFDTVHWEVYKYSNTIYFFSVGGIAAGVFWWLSINPKKSI